MLLHAMNGHLLGNWPLGTVCVRALMHAIICEPAGSWPHAGLIASQLFSRITIMPMGRSISVQPETLAGFPVERNSNQTERDR